MKQEAGFPASGSKTSGAAKLVAPIMVKTAPKKPVGPITYKVSKGSDVFWSGKAVRKG